jgi:hypothetical protein
MAVDFSKVVLDANYEFWSRPVTVTPVASQPGAPSYGARGIYSSGAIAIPAEGGMVISDQQTILDIMEVDFPVLPRQFDQITIPTDPASGLPPLGDFEVVDVNSDGGGETTLVLRKLGAAVP